MLMASRFRPPRLAAQLLLLTVTAAALGVPTAAARGATTAGSSADTTAAWQNAIASAAITKDNIDDPYYQYPLIGNGGLSLMPGPTGFTDSQPPNAPYAPQLASDTWWNGDSASSLPFSLSGGYLTGGGAVSEGTIDSFHQTLNVGTGTLTSELSVTPPTGAVEGTAQLTSTRTEYVTPAGVLVIEVEDSVPGRFAVQLGDSSGNSYVATSSGLTATASGGGPSGTLAAAVEVSGGDVQIDAPDGIVSAMVGPSAPATFYVSAGGVDSATPATEAQSAATSAADEGYSSVLADATGFWTKFWGASSIDIPDPTLLKWYIRGQYYLGSLIANAYAPTGVSGPTGEYNGDTDLEYDGVYDTLALLAANEPEAAEVTGNWIERSLPAAEALAPYYTYPEATSTGGAKYAWLGDYQGDEDNQFGPTPVANDWLAYPSANAAMVDILIAQYMNDPDRLARAEHVLDEVTQYQLDNSAREASLGNEFVDQQGTGLIFGFGSFVQGQVGDQAGLLWSLREAAQLGVGPAVWGSYANDVYIPTAYDATRGANVIAGYVGDDPTISSQPYLSLIPWYFFRDLSPQSELANPTLENLVGSPVLGDTLMIGNTAVGADILGDGQQAWQLVKYMVDASSSLTPGTADLWDDTYFSEGGNCNLPNADCAPGPGTTPNISGHSSFDQALQYMLFDGESPSTIRVFPALPPEWEKAGASFTDMLANGDILVSGSYSEAATSVTLTNEGPAVATRKLIVRIPADADRLVESGGTVTAVTSGQFASVNVTIAPGASQTVSFTPAARGTWQTVDDSDSRIGYSSGWTQEGDVTGLIEGTAHETDSPNGSATLAFTGTAVRVIGECDPDNGQFSVTIDGRLRGWYDAWCPEDTKDDVIFEADGLRDGIHTITVAASALQDEQATTTTDPETGEPVPIELLSLDAFQIGNFDVGNIAAGGAGASSSTSTGAGGALVSGGSGLASSLPPPAKVVMERARVGRVTLGRNGSVTERIVCPRARSRACAVTTVLSVVERLVSGHAVALSAARRRYAAARSVGWFCTGGRCRSKPATRSAFRSR